MEMEAAQRMQNTDFTFSLPVELCRSALVGQFITLVTTYMLLNIAVPY